MASNSSAGSPQNKGKLTSPSPADGDDASTPDGCSSDDQRNPFVLVPRPAGGPLGAPIKVCANLFNVTVAAEMSVYLYEVLIENDRLPARVNRKVVKALINADKHLGLYFGDVATVCDGRTKLYTNALIPMDGDQETMQISVPQERLDEMIFTVKIRFIRKVSIDCSNGLYAMYTVLKHYSSLRYFDGSSFLFASLCEGVYYFKLHSVIACSVALKYIKVLMRKFPPD